MRIDPSARRDPLGAVALAFLTSIVGCSSSSDGNASSATPDSGSEGAGVGAAAGPDAATPGDDDAGSGLTLGGSSDASADSGATCTSRLYLLGQDTGSAPDMSQPINLYSFDPEGPTLKKVGAIPCLSAAVALEGMTMSKCAPATAGGCTAALAAGDDGTAYVITPYREGATTPQQIVHVDLGDASCVGSPVAASAGTDQIVGATFLNVNATGSSGDRLVVSVEETNEPSGNERVGFLDPSSGVVSMVQAVGEGAEVDVNWFRGGGFTSSLGHFWTIATQNSDENLEAGFTNCSTGPCTYNEQPDNLLPAALTFAEAPWTPIFAHYSVLTTNMKGDLDAFYFFAPGWWSSGSREVDVVNDEVTTANGDLTSATSVIDLGVNIFAASDNPLCPPLATPPPVPPVVVR